MDCMRVLWGFRFRVGLKISGTLTPSVPAFIALYIFIICIFLGSYLYLQSKTRSDLNE